MPRRIQGRRLVAGALIGCGLALVAAACTGKAAVEVAEPRTTTSRTPGTSTSTLPPTTTSTTAPRVTAARNCSPTARSSGRPVESDLPQVEFHLDQVSAASQQRTMCGVELGYRFLAENLSAVTVPIRVDAVVDQSRAGSGGAMQRTVTLRFGTNGWPSPSPWHLEKVAAHEFIHLWQQQFYVTNQTGPTWLAEAAAEDLAFRSVLAEGFLTPAEARQFNIADAGRHPQNALQSFEQISDIADFSYGMARLAAELLVRDKGVTAYQSYWTLLNRRTPWQDAFATAFGIAPGDFYTKFEAYRTNGFR